MTQILPFKAQKISLLISEQEVQAFFLNMSVDLGRCWQRANTWTPYGRAFVLQKTDCYSSYSIFFFFFATKGCSFIFPGCLLWKLTDVPSILVSKAEIPIIQKWVGSASQWWLFLPALFNILVFKATEIKYEVLSYQSAKEKKNR